MFMVVLSRGLNLNWLEKRLGECVRRGWTWQQAQEAQRERNAEYEGRQIFVIVCMYGEFNAGEIKWDIEATGWNESPFYFLIND